MAIICTDNLLGNDTSGEGTPLAPYKTIIKALEVAIDDDFIKVAGGQFEQIPDATVTLTSSRGTTFTTSTNLTSVLSIHDVIAIDTFATDGWDKERTLYVISAISATTITVNGQAIQLPLGTYDIYKFSTYHYQNNNNSVIEVITSIPANTLTVSGGWSSDFTTQIGWTCSRYTGGTSTATSGTFITTSNLIKPNVVFDKFLLTKMGFNHGSTNGSIGIDTINFINTRVTFGSSNYAIFHPTVKGFATLILNSSAATQAFNGGGNKPDVLILKQYATDSFNQQALKFGYNSNYGSSTGPDVKSLEINARTSCNGGNVSSSAIIWMGNSQGADVWIDTLNINVNNTSILPLIQEINYFTAWHYVGNINVYTDGTNAGICVAQSVLNADNAIRIAPFNINRTSGTLDALPWRYYGTSATITNFYKSSMTAIYGKDTEGQKVIGQDNIIKYADPTVFETGVNSLRQKFLTNTAGGDSLPHIIATTAKPNVPFQVSIRMKANRAISSSNTSFRLLFGQAVTQELILGNNPVLTADWATYTYSVDPSLYEFWTEADDGLMSIFYRTSSAQTSITDNDYFWVDNVSITIL